MTTSGRMYSLGWLAMVSLILLRVAVGWHFFKEGVAKLRNPNFSSRPFLQEARGPLATFFWSWMEDPFELQRLDERQVSQAWDAYVEVLRSKVTEEPILQELDAAAKRWKGRLASFYREISAELPDYRAKAEPLAVLMRTAKERSQPFVDRQTRARVRELQQTRAPWLAELGRLEQLMRADLEEIAGVSAAPALGPGSPTKNWIDHTVTFTTLCVGVLLLIGLMVPLASLVGSVFLLTVMATQPFWAEGANLSFAYYQAIEIAALLVLATTGAGRFAGLDYFWSTAKK